jgi:hypothetical protein
MRPPEILKLDDTYSLAMTLPEPKTFNSHIEVLTNDNEKIEANLQVNKPLKVSGWTLYQLSYDQRWVNGQRLSVIEAIRDPWLGVVYAGFLW